MGGRYNEGLRDWQNMFIITRFINLYRGSFSYCLIFYHFWSQKNSSLHRGLRYRGSIVIYTFIVNSIQCVVSLKTPICSFKPERPYVAFATM